MRQIATLPRLLMLMGQGAVASDEGWEALSRSQGIEYIWGRECPNFTGRGFAALATMPTLRGIGISCKHVNDASLSAFPSFPALRQIMPMDVPDAGFRHVGRCENLEALWCMYCRETSDSATEHIEQLSRLKTYYAGMTQITNRSLEILSRMSSLEHLEFWGCQRITDVGLLQLLALPRLREITVSGSPGVTPDVLAAFPRRRVREILGVIRLPVPIFLRRSNQHQNEGHELQHPFRLKKSECCAKKGRIGSSSKTP